MVFQHAIVGSPRGVFDFCGSLLPGAELQLSELTVVNISLIACIRSLALLHRSRKESLIPWS
jgi:hypothetical protein